MRREQVRTDGPTKPVFQARSSEARDESPMFCEWAPFQESPNPMVGTDSVLVRFRDGGEHVYSKCSRTSVRIEGRAVSCPWAWRRFCLQVFCLQSWASLWPPVPCASEI